jgi:coronin-1B/1C/6
MSGRFVRASKFRHVYGQASKRELCYDNLRLTTNAWDSNLIKINSKYLSVNWDSSGGGAFAVIPLGEVGKLPDQIPLFRGHTAAVLDTDWDPFDDSIVASGSDDGKIAIWKVPDNFTLKRLQEADEIRDVTPIKKLSGHSKKVGHVQFHPVAKNVLASSSGDYTIKIWDVDSGEVKYTLEHKDLISSFAFNYDGSLLASTSRDKRIRVWDIRAEKIVCEGPGHAGAKASRIVWLGNSDRLATTGFSRMSDRQLALWNAKDVGAGPIGEFIQLDSSAGICMPFYDEDTKCVYLAGKGDGNIRYFEFLDDEFFPLSEYQSVEPQRGLAFMPKRALNVGEHEVTRFYKTVHDTMIEPISFYVPRRADTFQSDIYPPTAAAEPALTAAEWFSGKNSGPKMMSLEAVFERREAEVFDADIRPVVKPTPEVKPTPVANKEEVRQPERSSTPLTKKQDVEDMFASKDVTNFLVKASKGEEEDVDENDKFDDSVWNEEPVQTEIIAEEPTETSSAEEPIERSVEKREAEKDDVEPMEGERRISEKKEIVDEEKIDQKNRHEVESNGRISLDETVSNLVGMIEELNMMIKRLVGDLEAKEDRLNSLESQLKSLQK